jgi:hypothetical protein
MPILVLKLAVCIASTVALLWANGSEWVQGLDAKAFIRFLASYWLLTRAGAYLALYVFLNHDVPSDVNNFYFPLVQFTRQGKLPYRDFYSEYGPLFTYIAALPTLVWNSPKAIVALTMVIEVASIVLWTRVLQQYLEPAAVRRAQVLYLLNPFPMMVMLVGQNQVWIAALLAVALLLNYRNRDGASGAAFAWSLVAVKILPLFYFPAFVCSTRRLFRWLAGFSVVMLLVYIPVLLLHMNPLVPIFTHQTRSFSSGNVFFLLNMGKRAPVLFNLLLPASWSVAFAGLVRMRLRRPLTLREACWALCILQLVFSLFAWKSLTNYFMMVYFPIAAYPVFHTGSSWRMVRWVAFSWLLTMEPSLWFRWAGQGQIDAVLTKGVLGYSFIALEILLICLCASYLWEAVRDFRIRFSESAPAGDLAGDSGA